jgi:hypothetical protein
MEEFTIKRDWGEPSTTRREIIFERETSADGGPLDLWQVPNIFYELRMVYAIEAARMFRETQAKPGRGGPIPWIFPAFVQNLSLDSASFCIEKEYYIALYAGGFLVPHDAFSTLLSHPDIFTDIGKASKERFRGEMPWKGVPLDLGYNYDLSGMIKSMLSSMTPQDGFRKQYALTLARLSFDFLFYHEMAHILAGHLDLLESDGERAFLRENSEFHFQENSSATRYWDLLEYDADRISASFILRFLSLGLDLKAETKQERKKQKDIFLALARSIGALFKLQSKDLPDMESYRYRSHPHPEVRFLQFFVELGSLAGEISTDLKKIVTSSYTEAQYDLACAWETLGMHDPMWEKYDKNLHDDLSISVINRLDDMEPILTDLCHHRDIRRWSRLIGKYVYSR